MDEKEKIPTEVATPVVPKSGNKVVETYAEDMAKVIGDDQAGLIKKIIHDEEMKKEMQNSMSPESVQNKLYMVFSFIFLFLTLVIFGFLLLNRESKVVVPEKVFTPIISLDKFSLLEIDTLSKDQVADKFLYEVKNSVVKNGDLEGVYLTSLKNVIGLKEFLSLMNISFDPEQAISDTFLLGFLNTQNRSPFILLKAKSFQDAFPVMRSWEYKMYLDLSQLFVLPQENYLFTKEFEDTFVENKNARILYDKNGGVVLMYVYIDDNSVLVTSSKEVVREVIERVFSGKVENN